MERIHNLLRKIQDIYYKKEEKQVIDIDLMLDYARVLYADLLDARTDLLAKQGMGLHLKESPAKAAVPAEEKGGEGLRSEPQNNDATQAVSDAASVDAIEEAPEEKNTAPIQEVGDAMQQAATERLERIKAEQTEVTAGEAVEEEQEVITNAGQPSENDPTEKEEVHPERTVTSDPVAQEEEEKGEEGEDQEEEEEAIAETPAKEEPATLEEVKEFAEEQIVETEPKPKNRVIINDDDFPRTELDNESGDEPAVFSEIHFELPEVKDKASESPKQGFLFQKHKDIRSFIGINDKYQFMNELFANNRTVYEETLDKLSAFETYQEAEQWLLGTVLTQNSWSKDDETFRSLLQTTKKFFAA